MPPSSPRTSFFSAPKSARRSALVALAALAVLAAQPSAWVATAARPTATTPESAHAAAASQRVHPAQSARSVRSARSVSTRRHGVSTRRHGASATSQRRHRAVGGILVAHRLRLPHQQGNVPRPTYPPPTDPGQGGTRNPLTWPFPATSIWNHPRGDNARLVSAGLRPPALKSFAAEEDLLFVTPNAPMVPVMAHNAAWSPSKTRCGSRTGETLFPGLPIATGSWTTEGTYWGSRPNHSAAVVLPDYTLIETQPLHVCKDGTVVSQYASPLWRGSSIISGAEPRAPGYGSHGGSYLSAFGGTIRLGEWTPGGAIRHAVKIEVDGHQYLSLANGGRRWPATRADQGKTTAYGGKLAALRMGALLTLPPSFDISSLSTEPARILARALKGYGAYIVDNAGRDVVAYATEWGAQGRVLDDFERDWGYSASGLASSSSGGQRAFLTDIDRLTTALSVVDDNAPGNVGGAGNRLAPWAPPFRRP